MPIEYYRIFKEGNLYNFPSQRSRGTKIIYENLTINAISQSKKMLSLSE